jgi:hypothetical protein
MLHSFGQVTAWVNKYNTLKAFHTHINRGRVHGQITSWVLSLMPANTQQAEHHRNRERAASQPAHNHSSSRPGRHNVNRAEGSEVDGEGGGLASVIVVV